MKFVVLATFLISSIFAISIGDFHFETPVPLTHWEKESSETDLPEAGFKMLSDCYQHTTKDLMQSVVFLVQILKNDRTGEVGFSEIRAEKYLMNKWQRIAEDLEDNKLYPNPQVSITDILETDSSLFAQITFLSNQKPYTYIWTRELKEKGKRVSVWYMIRQKDPHDPNFLTADTKEISDRWVKFLRDDFFKKLTHSDFK